MMPDVIVTKAEQRAIAAVGRAIDKLPESIDLFSFAGTLIAMKRDASGNWCDIGTVTDKRVDGGDPGEEEVRQNADIEFE